MVLGDVHRDRVLIEEPRDLLRRGPAVGDGFDDRGRRGAVVAADEDLRHDRLVGLGIDLDVAPPLHAELGELLRKPARLGRLPEREQNGVARDLELGPGYGDRAAASLLVRIAELVADEDHATHAAVRIGEHLGQRDEVDELDPLALGLGELLLVDDHLLAAAAHDHVHVLGAEAP